MELTLLSKLICLFGLAETFSSMMNFGFSSIPAGVPTREGAEVFSTIVLAASLLAAEGIPANSLTVSESKPAEISGDSNISFDKFRETDLRVATVKTAERVSGSDKLIKLDLDDGSGSRQIVAGIGKQYEPEKLINKQIVVVVNLEPRKLMGLESQGMLLAATNSDGHPILVIPEEEVKAGTRLS